MRARAGDDKVFFVAGDGPDVVWGGAGDDLVEGGNGPNLLLGGAGDDVIFGKGKADVIRGDAGRSTSLAQTAHMKKTPITDETKATFLANLAEGHTVKFAASAVGVERRTMYRLREEKDGEGNLTSEAAEFRDAWDEAFEAGVQMLEEEARRRAVEGIPGPKGTTSFSDTLLIFLLKAKRPNVYRDNSRVELTGAAGGPVEVELAHDEEEIRAALAAL